MIRFRSDNGIRYMQDHRMRVGIPSNVEFVVEDAPNLIGGGWRLHDRWYGGIDYGNGGLTIWHDDVRGSVSKRLQAAATAAEEK